MRIYKKVPGKEDNFIETVLRKGLLIPLLWWLHLTAAAQPFGDYTIKRDEPLQPLYDHFLYYFDTSEKATIQDFLSGKIPAAALRAYDLADSRFVFDWYRPFWLKLTLHAPFAIKDYRIAIPNLRNLAGCMNGTGLLGAYIVKDGKLLQHYEAGNLEPRSKKIIKDPVNVNAFPISLDSGETVELYLRQYDQQFYWRSDSYYLLHPDYPLVIKTGSLNDLEFFYLGIMFILFAFGVAFLFVTRQQVYLWFALCALSHLMHTMLILPENPFVKWLTPEHPAISMYAIEFFIGTNVIFFILFGRRFAGIRQISRWNDWLLLALIAYTLFYVLFYFTDFLAALLFFSYWKWLMLISIPVFAITGIRLLLEKTFSARCLGIALCWLVLFQTLGTIKATNTWFVTHQLNPWIIAPIGYMIIIFFGLAYRYRKAETEKAEAIRVKEMDKIKSRFFANISHEFRTPLTLMLGPLKQMEQGALDESDSRKYLKMMRHNGERLLHLINQMLDLSKLESGKMGLEVARTDITGLLKATVYSFNSMAEQKQVNYHTHFPEQEIIGWIDKDKFQKIVTNLLSNAFKYTPENGTVSVDVENGDKRLRITIQDNGPGIPKEQLDKIFDRFYQVEGTEGGTGIGLSLVKELVQLHKGQISVSSDTGRGASFRFSIPVAREFYAEEEIGIAERKTEPAAAPVAGRPAEGETAEPVADSLLPVVLVVEDNADLQTFITDTLKKEFNVIRALNGKEGLEKALEQIPDLIISDVMMPVMDGVTMTQEIKKNEKTSHIPVIILTAKAASESRIEGLKSGADDYLVKPFDGDELIVRIKNLVEQRQKLMDLFSRKVISIQPEEAEVTSQEGDFISKVRQTISDNLDNEFFSVVELANAVNMSRSQLHRKLKALTGSGPNELIRNFRLEQALHLLQQGAGNVTEVAFMTGFSSPAYFSKCFGERYGYPPAEVKRKSQG